MAGRLLSVAAGGWVRSGRRRGFFPVDPARDTFDGGLQRPELDRAHPTVVLHHDWIRLIHGPDAYDDGHCLKSLSLIARLESIEWEVLDQVAEPAVVVQAGVHRLSRL